MLPKLGLVKKKAAAAATTAGALLIQEAGGNFRSLDLKESLRALFYFIPASPEWQKLRLDF